MLQDINSQNSRDQWMLELSGGIEQHDKRLFDYPEKDRLLAMQTDKWGTYHAGLIVKRNMWDRKRFSVYGGIGLHYEKATFLRPFNHFHFKEVAFDILRNLNRYTKLQVPLVISIYYKFGDHWSVSGELTPQLLVYRSIDHTENNSDVFPYSESTLELDDIHFSLGLHYRIKHFTVGINSRLFNFQKIDEIIFNDIVKDPRADQTWEWYNPLRFDLTVAYVW